MYLDNNWIKVIDPICQLKKLQILDLCSNEISTIDAIASLVQLKELYLNNNKISQIDSIARCVGLEVLYLDSNAISIINPIGECTQLEILHLGNNEISDIDILNKCKDLRVLHLNNNKIKKIDALSECSELLIVSLNNNKLLTLAPLTSLKLRKLSAINNKISSIDSLMGRTSLRVLILCMNKIPRLDSLITCHKLTQLDVRKNKISEIAPLANLPLRQLKLNNNPISMSDPFSYLDRLKKIILHGDLHLFLAEKDIATITNAQLLERRNLFLEYQCLSHSSNFLKLVSLKESSSTKIQETFDQLDHEDKCLIHKTICEEWTFLGRTPPMTDDNLFLSADLLFSNRDILQRAAKKALLIKFNHLPEKNKLQVYREIYNLTNVAVDRWEEPYALDEREEVTKILWGKERVFFCSLLLADAMDNVKSL